MHDFLNQRALRIRRGQAEIKLQKIGSTKENLDNPAEDEDIAD